MRYERQAETTHVMFLVYTDAPVSVSYLQNWDQTMDSVDITDTFENERRYALRRFGNNFVFSMANYMLKLLLGAIGPSFDQIND